MKTYLAGKVEGSKWRVVQDCSITEWVASDGSNHSEHLWGGGYHPVDMIGNTDLQRAITDEVFTKLSKADCLVAYLDTPDSYGSVVEITLMVAMGKPCLIVIRMPVMNYSEEPDSLLWEQANIMADAYWFVSCLPEVRAITVESEEEATDVIRSFLLQTRARQFS